jgi:hypothetical protein
MPPIRVVARMRSAAANAAANQDCRAAATAKSTPKKRTRAGTEAHKAAAATRQRGPSGTFLPKMSDMPPPPPVAPPLTRVSSADLNAALSVLMSAPSSSSSSSSSSVQSSLADVRSEIAKMASELERIGDVVRSLDYQMYQDLQRAREELSAANVRAASAEGKLEMLEKFFVPQFIPTKKSSE